MEQNYQLKENAAKKRFELDLDGKIAFVEYIKTPNRMFLTHTEVPVGLEGQGIGSAIIKLSLEEVEKTGLPLMPLCPFVAAYIKKHPEWRRILVDGVNV